MDAQKVAQFDQMMTHERVNGNSAYESELKKGYRDILLGMIANYSEYRAQAARFLSSLETNNIHSLPYSLDVFFELSDLLIKTGDFELFDLSILIQKVNANTVTNIKSVLEAALSKGQRLRLSEDNFDISFLSDQDKKEIATLIIKGLHQDAEKVIWDKDMVENSLMQLVLLRQTLVILGRAELFYHAIGLFFDRLISSEFYQTARDLAEEVIWSSYKDQIPEHGYFNSFRIYSLIGSIHASLFYANLSLTSILQKNPPYSEKYIKEIIWQGMKFFRNVNLFPWANRLYNSIPNGLSFLDFERRSLDH
ncbi:MAG TPA: hypothetical protein VI603_09480, partial [Saprospiraceae bacterium]|nr:hypothetical protein [Saprospiraceae bacterium]